MQLTALNYYGGKARPDFRNWLVPKIPYDKDGMYVEPFAGMLGVLLARPKCKIEVINDLDSNICNWWKVIQSNPVELEHLTYYTPTCRRTFRDAAIAIKEKQYQDNPMMWAWATYTVLTYGMRHGLTSFTDASFTIRYTKDIHSRVSSKIGSLSDRLKGVDIRNVDALDIIRQLSDFNNAVIYCDPPYLTADTSNYNYDDIDVDAFSDAFLSHKGKVAISGYRDEWDHLRWERHERITLISKLNHTQTIKHKNDNRIEVLWTNYSLEDNQLSLF